MEEWDVYDKNGVKTGETAIRGEKLKENQYHLAVHVWIVNSNGEFLIQKRSATKEVLPNMWAVTGGSALKGENSEEACIRETEEELGITLDKNELLKIGRTEREATLVDIWLTHKEVNTNELILQEEEVSDAKWMNPDKIYDLVNQNKFTPSAIEGMRLCIDYLANEHK